MIENKKGKKELKNERIDRRGLSFTAVSFYQLKTLETMNGLNYLIEAYNITKNYSNESSDEQMKRVQDNLKAFIYMNIVCGASKFDMYKFVSNEEHHKALTGVFHDKGFKIATDGHALVLIESIYPDEYEGKILLKDGKEVYGRYPNYRAVLPYYGDEVLESKMSTGRLKEVISAFKAEKKLSCNKHLMCYMLFNETFFSDTVVEKMAMFLRKFPDAKILQFKDPEKRSMNPVTFEAGNNKALFMPSIKPDESKEENVIVNY